MKNLSKELGILCYDDYKAEENTYCLGMNDYIPISLLLSLLSHYKQSPYRIFNIFASTYAIKNGDLDFSHILTKKDEEDINDMFNKDYVHEHLSKTKEPLNFEPDYKEMELHNYVDVWNVFLNMATPKYDTNSEYQVLCCSLDFVRFHNRKEFVQPVEAVKDTLVHILKEVSSIMKKRGFHLSSDGYHIYHKGFKPLQIKQSYSF